MEERPERKIPCTVSLTPRQLRVVKDEAGRQGITLPDYIRRLVDIHIDQLERTDIERIMR